MRYFILTLLLSFSFSECDDLNALQCSSNTDCEWIEDITTGSCSSFSNSQQCDSTPGCNWDCIQMGWWYNWCYTYGCEGGTYEIDNGYCEDSDYIQGDLNGDTILNILDIIIIVDIILNQESNDLADINGDGGVNILDIVALVEIILE